MRTAPCIALLALNIVAHATKPTLLARNANLVAAQRQLDPVVLAALEKDARCKTRSASATSKDSKCTELCKGNAGCIDVCNEVRGMICTGAAQPGVVTVTQGDSAAAAAAAASAASNAVQAAVKDAIKEAAMSAQKATADAKKMVRKA